MFEYSLLLSNVECTTLWDKYRFVYNSKWNMSSCMIFFNVLSGMEHFSNFVKEVYQSYCSLNPPNGELCK